ncbi:MAG: FKBP-type peptidyl-prolyl cis-trans isomerase [Bacteroidales bacterium]|nr:FKBP-type peptidyl-prolyl cis-trans isomerase [Bacteroidales bacterium]
MRTKLILMALLCGSAIFNLKAQESSDSASVAAATALGSMVKENVDRLNHIGIPINYDVFATTFTQVLKGEDTGMTPDQANEYMSRLFYEAQAARMKADTVSVASQKEFLAKMAAQEGAVTYPSGVILIVETEGEGPMPTADDTVLVSYSGRLSDGTVFDDTYGQAVEFPVSGLIPGFTEGLEHMHPGGTYRLIIPADQGYGTHGAGPIPGNAALDFTVTLEGIETAQAM